MGDEYCPVCSWRPSEFIGVTSSRQSVYLCPACYSFYGVKTDTVGAWILERRE